MRSEENTRLPAFRCKLTQFVLFSHQRNKQLLFLFSLFPYLLPQTSRNCRNLPELLETLLKLCFLLCARPFARSLFGRNHLPDLSLRFHRGLSVSTLIADQTEPFEPLLEFWELCP